MKNRWTFNHSKYTLAEDSQGTFHLVIGGKEIATGSAPYLLLVQALKEQWMTYDEVLGAANALKIDKFFVQEEECTNSSEQ